MNNHNSGIANEQTLLINFLKDSERTQEDTLKVFKEKIENIVSRGKDSSKSAKDEKEALSKAIEALYREASVIQKPFGKTVEAIMIEKGNRGDINESRISSSCCVRFVGDTNEQICK